VNDKLRRVVMLVALLNASYFGFEFAIAQSIGSVSLFADSVDLLEDASLNILIAVALGWSDRNRARLGMALACILLVPSVATLWAAWVKIHTHLPPAPLSLTLTGVGALAVNLFCALVLVRYRKHSGSLTRAAFLSSRNDVLANLAIILSGFITAYTHSGWTDIVVGLGIAGLNADAMVQVWRAARVEHALN
jgi:Co/Zn/Cd efflux system component